jgi:hypothetical protein
MTFLDEGTVEKSLVEMMTAAVVAEIQAENIIPLPVEESPGGEHIGGVKPSLPPVEKENQSAGHFSFLRGVKPEQADAVSRIDQDFTGPGIQLFLAQRPDFQAGYNRLEMRISQPDRRKEWIMDGDGVHFFSI